MGFENPSYQHQSETCFGLKIEAILECRMALDYLVYIGAVSMEAGGAAAPPGIFFAPLDHLCPRWHLDLIINI